MPSIDTGLLKTMCRSRTTFRKPRKVGRLRRWR